MDYWLWYQRSHSRIRFEQMVVFIQDHHVPHSPSDRGQDNWKTKPRAAVSAALGLSNPEQSVDIFCEKSSTMRLLVKSKDITKYDIYSALEWDHNVPQDESNGRVHVRIPQTFSDTLVYVEQFVIDVLKNKLLAYEWKDGRGGERTLEKFHLARYFPSLDTFIGHLDLLSTSVRYSEYAALFFKCVRKLNLQTSAFNFRDRAQRAEECGADSFNLLISTIREEARSPEFKAALKGRKENCDRNFKSNAAYLNALIRKYSKLYVLRIDLYYAAHHSAHISVDDARKDLRRFFNKLRQNSLFKNLSGLIWKLEDRRQRGYHFHLMFFFNDKEDSKIEQLADKIGAYWCERIVPERGRFNDCRNELFNYWKIGIGELNRHDVEKKNELLIALRYLTKKQQYWMILTEFKTIGHMNAPKTKPNRATKQRATAQLGVEG